MLTLTIQPHQKSVFFNLFAIVSTLQKNLIFFQNWRFFLTCKFFMQIYFQVQSFFRWNFFFWIRKIKENFIRFRNMFLKNK